MYQIQLLILFLTLLNLSTPQCCSQFNQSQCIKCPDGMHLYMSNCIYDISNCQQYLDGFDCARCEEGFQFNIISSECEAIPNEIATSQQKTYTDILIQLDNLSTIEGEGLLIIQDFLIVTKPQLNGYKISGAILRKFQNGTDHYIIEYKSRNNKYYEAVVEFNLEIFTFQQISFNPIEQLSIFTEPKTENYDSDIHGKTPQFLLFDQKVKIQNSALKSVISGTITMKSQSIQYKLKYEAKQNGAEYEVSGEVTGKTVTINSIIKTKQGQLNNLNNMDIQMNRNYNEFNPNSMDPNIGDQFFVIIKDYLYTIKPQISQNQIKKAQKFVDGQKIYYKVYIRNENNSESIFYLSLITTQFVITLDKEQNYEQQQNVAIYEQVPQNQILTDFHFLVVLDTLNTQFNGKYAPQLVTKLQKKEDEQTTSIIDYMIYFDIEGVQQKVKAQIDKGTFEVNILSENTQSSSNNPQNQATENQIPSILIQTNAGMVLLTQSQELTDAGFIQVRNLIEQVNSDELTDKEFVAAFYENSGFSQNFKIYYKIKSGQSLYEAVAIYDRIRKRVYIQSFGKFAY